MRRASAILAVTCATLLLTLIASNTSVNRVRASPVHPNIIVDGNPSDWLGTATGVPNTGAISEGEYIWTDAVDDDKGDGDYTYPTHEIYEGDKEMDLTEFRVTANMTHLFFLIKVAELTDPWGPAPYGWSIDIFNIYIDQDPAMETGYNATINIHDSPTDAVLANVWWDYALALSGWDSYLLDSPTHRIAPDVSCAGDIDYDAIEVAVPFTMLGWGERKMGETWRFVVLTGINYFDQFVEIVETNSYWSPGGGASDTAPYPDVECDAFDGAFYTSNENQYMDWSDYDAATNKITVLGNYPQDAPEGYVDIESVEGKVIPRFPDPLGLRISFSQLSAAKVSEGQKISVHANVVYDINDSICVDANVSATIREVIINFESMGNGTYFATIDTVGLSDYFTSKNYTLFILAAKSGFSPAISTLSFEVMSSFWPVAPLVALVSVLVVAVIVGIGLTVYKRESKKGK